MSDLLHKPLKDEIFDVLYKRIIAGKYLPGEWLRQEEVASQLGVSMTPVREALDLLVSAGLAERVPYRGVRILQLSDSEIVEAYGLRLLLETSAARVAAVFASPEQLQELKQLLEQMQSQVMLSQMHTLRQLNREFHLLLVQAAGSPLLTKTYTLVVNSFPDWMLYEAMFRHPELLSSSLAAEHAEHSQIVAALEACDPDLAAHHIATHIRNLGKELQQFLNISALQLAEKERQLHTN